VGNSLFVETKSDELDRSVPLSSAPPRHLSYGLVRALPFCISRLAFAAFLLLTSLYCILVWVPFSYFGFIRHPLMSWIPVFVHLHALFYAVVLVPVCLTQISHLRRTETRRAAAGFLAVNGLGVIYLWRTDGLANVQPDLQSYIWSLLWLFPLMWLSALDLWEMKWIESKRGNRTGAFVQLTVAGIVVAVVFALTSLLRAAHEGSPLAVGMTARGLAASFCLHIVLFAAFGLTLDLLAWIARKTTASVTTNKLLTGSFAWLVIVQLLRKIIFPAISFEGWLANVFAAGVAFALVLFAADFSYGLSKYYDAEGRSRSFSGWLLAIAAISIFLIACGIPAALARTDWDFVLQRIAVIALWLLAWQTIRWSGVSLQMKRLRVAAIAIAACALAGFASYARLALYNPYPSSEWQSVLDSYSGLDLSFKTAGDILSRRADNRASSKYYDLLKENTNLGRDVVAGPVDTDLVSSLQHTDGVKPNIFVFVIDSLRRDFISPYNPAVDYTPEIGRFAAESVVMENAYTRYGGTALSEPAIWVGAMQLHKQYIEPFYPMNNLQKLLDVDGYQSYVSVDPIVAAMLHPSSSITELDKKTKLWGELDFVPTLKDLEEKIDSRTDRTKPIFAYTQPQNVHTLTLERSKIAGGRRAISIHELRRMDTAFGEFVSFLRQHGLYDNSIIILTADHGDCYGEFGRWGHSDFLFPPVIRIPLIVHLPPQMRRKVVASPRELAFTTDITPSLFYLLGHRPILNNEVLGRPLFTDTIEEQRQYWRAQYLIVCSYAPVYAILSGNGQSLFISDAVNSKNYYYNLVEDPDGLRNHVTVQAVSENQPLIEQYIEQIDDFYHWHPGGERATSKMAMNGK